MNLENIMLQPEIKHKVNYDEYDSYLEHLAEKEDREYEDGDDL